MAKPPNLAGNNIVFVEDGVILIAYSEAEVTRLGDGGLLVNIPVVYYSEEWEWLAGGSVYAGAEPQDAVVGEALAWHAGRASLTVAP